jgi:PPOX class probable FMN-dependent enzyme
MNAAVEVEDACTLRELYDAPSERALKKQLPALDRHCRAFIALSPFVVVASSGADGTLDASPRGDAPGFVAVLDEQTLLIPDRPGNNRLDTMGNFLENPHIGLLFLVPGVGETLRVNGSVRITTDPALLAPLSAGGRQPKAGLLVTVAEAYLQCPKALIRSDLWNPAKHVDRRTLPTLGQMLADQIPGVDAEAADQSLAEAIRTRLH